MHLRNKNKLLHYYLFVFVVEQSSDEITPTHGTRLFNNLTMNKFLKENIIGYCPQFDAVDEYLTGKEALYIYARIIGLIDYEHAILNTINRFKLGRFIDQPIKNYSGGMKRTISVAIALLGDPQIVLLDEPTNGMVTNSTHHMFYDESVDLFGSVWLTNKKDPEMRRRVWDILLRFIKDDRSVLLTSHSMAECDALCSRLAIMVDGQFVCLGTTQHLKNRYRYSDFFHLVFHGNLNTHIQYFCI